MVGFVDYKFESRINSWKIRGDVRNKMKNNNVSFLFIKMYQPMYGQGYPGGYLTGYPTAYGPLQYYPPLAAAAAYYPAAAMQPAPVRSTLMVPVSILHSFSENI